LKNLIICFFSSKILQNQGKSEEGDGNNNNSQDISKLIDNLVEQYPNPFDFINEINFMLDSANIGINRKLDSLYTIGTYLYSKYKFNHAISILENLVSIIDSSSLSSSSSLDYKVLQLKMNSLIYLGLAAHALGNYQQAIDYHNQSLDIAKRIGDVAAEGTCYGNLGLAAHALGNYQQAIDYYNQSLDIAKRSGDVSREGTCYGNLGAAADALGNYQQAIDY
jgi:tetratricopeptide (TPR) repeat protein